MWRVVLGHHLTPHSLAADADGIWRPPGAPGIEVLLHPHAIDVAYDPLEHTVAGALERVGWERADCYLGWIPEYRALPVDAACDGRALALMVGDWNLAGQMLRVLQPYVDAVLCDRPGVEVIRAAGFATTIELLPWGWDVARWPVGDPASLRDIDVLFVGSRNRAVHGARERWLARLGRLAGRFDVRIHASVHGAAYRELAGRAKIVFNHSVRGEANMRLFEAAIAGACVLNERANATVASLFRDGIDHATYDECDLEQVIELLLADGDRRVALAQAGLRVARTHTYEAHLLDALPRLRSAVEGRVRPSRPGWDHTVAEQWRLCTEPSGWTAGSRHLRRTGLLDPRALVRYESLASCTPLVHDDATATAAALTATEIGLLTAPDDGALLLARAEACTRAGRAHEAAVCARRLLETGPIGPAVPTCDWSEWRVRLETASLTDAGAADRWARARARYLLAVIAGDSLPAATDLLDDERLGILPILYVGAQVRLALLDFAGARSAYERVVRETPLDPDPARELARLSAALGDRSAAARTLDDLAASLAGFPENAGLAAALRAEAATYRVAPADATLVFADDLAPDALGAVIHARASGGLPGAVLRIAVRDDAHQTPVVAELLTKLASLGIAPDALPETEVLQVDGPVRSRWQAIGSVARVVAPAGGITARIAGALAIEVVDVPAPTSLTLAA